VKLFKGKATVVGRKSEHSLYSKKLATYDEGSDYDQSAAQGFIKIHGLSQQTQARRQLLKGGRGFDLPGLPGKGE
jgi:argininosuccinate synthase